jgi:hypothetical protein
LSLLDIVVVGLRYVGFRMRLCWGRVARGSRGGWRRRRGGEGKLDWRVGDRYVTDGYGTTAAEPGDFT